MKVIGREARYLLFFTSMSAAIIVAQVGACCALDGLNTRRLVVGEPPIPGPGNIANIGPRSQVYAEWVRRGAGP
jgi:hypothetical protein